MARIQVRAHVARDHPWATRDRIDLAELVNQRLVLLTHEHITRVVLDQAVGDAGLSYAHLVECGLPNAILALAASGYGIGVVSDEPGVDTHPLLIVDRRTPDRPLSIGNRT
ncbi:LysR family transcriptional regulator substrate-binding protein [Saccharopolyspora sp. 5N102]|uniref:LysR family transcriptional regulator substrate-binding protein n=1 Tax=Saccharopolyspora sp. 5N102 TaxID=3375155 RepID=UPI0037A702F4